MPKSGGDLIIQLCTSYASFIVYSYFTSALIMHLGPACVLLSELCRAWVLHRFPATINNESWYYTHTASTRGHRTVKVISRDPRPWACMGMDAPD